MGGDEKVSINKNYTYDYKMEIGESSEAYMETSETNVESSAANLENSVGRAESTEANTSDTKKSARTDKKNVRDVTRSDTNNPETPQTSSGEPSGNPENRSTGTTIEIMDAEAEDRRLEELTRQRKSRISILQRSRPKIAIWERVSKRQRAQIEEAKLVHREPAQDNQLYNFDSPYQAKPYYMKYTSRPYEHFVNPTFTSYSYSQRNTTQNRWPPITATQQHAYPIQLAPFKVYASQKAPTAIPQSYSSETYNPQRNNLQGYSPQNNNLQSYSPQNENPQSYSPQNVTTQTFTLHTYTAQTFTNQTFDPNTYSTQSYEPRSHTSQIFDSRSFTSHAYEPTNALTQTCRPHSGTSQLFDSQTVTPQTFVPQTVTPQTYAQEPFSQTPVAGPSTSVRHRRVKSTPKKLNLNLPCTEHLVGISTPIQANQSVITTQSSSLSTGDNFQRPSRLSGSSSLLGGLEHDDLRLLVIGDEDHVRELNPRVEGRNEGVLGKRTYKKQN